MKNLKIIKAPQKPEKQLPQEKPGKKHWPYEKSKKNKGPQKSLKKMALGKAF